MTTYGASVNESAEGVKTTAEYGDRGDGVSSWHQWEKNAAVGDAGDAAATSASGDQTAIALLKGLLNLVAVGTTSIGASAVAAGSGNVANATATATLPATASKRTWVQKIIVTGAGATAASVVTGTITGLAGGTRTWNLVIPAGVTTSIVPLVLDFGNGFPASADNTQISVSVPAAGVGNTNLSVNIFGYVR